MGEVGTFQYGITVAAQDKDTGIKLIRITDIKDGGIDWKNMPYCEIPERDFKRYRVNVGDVLFARIGATTGKTCYIDRDVPAVFGSYLLRFNPSTNGVESQYLYHFTQSTLYWNQVDKLKGGQLKKGLNTKLLASLKVPLPPLPEQQKIAHVLMSIDKAIETIDEAIKQAERIKKGLMQELLTRGIGHKEFKDTEIGRIPKEWEVVELKEVAEGFITGGTPSTKEHSFWNGDIPWIRSVHITKYYIDYSSVEQYITKEGLENSAANIVPRNNLVVATRVGIGKSAVNLIDVAINQDLTGIILDKSKVDPMFIVWYLHSPNIIKIFESLSRGTTIKGITQSSLKKLQTPLPPLQEQQKIAEILSKWDEVIELKKNKKERLERMKKRVMDLLITGKVRIK